MLVALYHLAVRRSIRAFPTSPLRNILSECGLKPKLFISPNIVLKRLVVYTKHATRNYPLNSAGWKLLFTDGSKASYTSSAADREDKEPISYGLLFPFCSIFIAEASAILKAVQYSKLNRGKYIIFSDRLSCFMTTKSPFNAKFIINGIRGELL